MRATKETMAWPGHSQARAPKRRQRRREGAGDVLAHAAGSEELLACEPARVVGRQEDGDGGDVARLAGAAKRGLSHHALLEVGADETPCVRPFRFNNTGID